MELGLRLAFFATEGTYHRNWRIKLTYSWAGQRSAMRVHDVVLEVRFTARAGAFLRTCQCDVCCMCSFVVASLVVLCAQVLGATTYMVEHLSFINIHGKYFKINELFL